MIFYESVKLRSMRNARFKFVVDMLSSLAISSRVDLAFPFWHSYYHARRFYIILHIQIQHFHCPNLVNE